MCVYQFTHLELLTRMTMIVTTTRMRITVTPPPAIPANAAKLTRVIRENMFSVVNKKVLQDSQPASSVGGGSVDGGSEGGGDLGGGSVGEGDVGGGDVGEGDVGGGAAVINTLVIIDFLVAMITNSLFSIATSSGSLAGPSRS